MKNARVAKRYALALFNSAKQAQVLSEVHSDVLQLSSYLASSTGFRAVMLSPVIQSWRKKNILREVLRDAASNLTVSFTDVLCQKSRENVMKEIFEQFEAMYNKHHGILPMSVTTAVTIPDDAKALLEQTIAAKFSMKPSAEYKTDPGIVGGLTIQIGDTLMDSSVKTKLNSMRDSLVKGTL